MPGRRERRSGVPPGSPPAGRRYGWLVWPLRRLRRGINLLFDWRTLVVFRRCTRAGESASVMPPGLQIRKLDTGSSMLGLLCELFPDRDFPGRLARPDRQGYVAVVGDALAGFAWTATGRVAIDELEVVCHMRDDEIYIYDCLVLPRYRGRGIYQAMLREIVADVARADVSRNSVLIASMRGNRASRRGIVASGFVESARVHYWQLARIARGWRGLDTGRYTIRD